MLKLKMSILNGGEAFKKVMILLGRGVFVLVNF